VIVSTEPGAQVRRLLENFIFRRHQDAVSLRSLSLMSIVSCPREKSPRVRFRIALSIAGSPSRRRGATHLALGRPGAFR
jgi:hypothetical protein